jgi:hypothetical protein
MSEFAYWISPKGELHKPRDRHVASIIEDPVWFGETDASVKAVFDKYEEPVSTSVEGKAREELLLKMIKKGYARIRLNRTRRNQSYSIQVDRITKKLEDTLFVWANIESKDAYDKYADVNVYELGKGSGSGKLTRTSLDRIASGEGINEEVSDEVRSHLQNIMESIVIYEVGDLYITETWKENAFLVNFNGLNDANQARVYARTLSL